MAYLNKATKKLMQQLHLKGGVASRTLTGAVTIDDTTENYCSWDPGGAHRDVTLPAIYGYEGAFFSFYNAADAAENLVIKNAAGSTLVTLGQGEKGMVGCTSTAWVVLEAAPAAAALPGTANTWDLLQTYTVGALYPDAGYTAWGTGSDVVVAWDGTRLNVTQAAPNSEIRWGVDGAGIDQRWYGDTASAYALWDQSADTLVFGGVAGVQGAVVKTNGATAITTTRAVTRADSGGIFTVAQSSAYTVTVAQPAAAGERYLFQCVSPGAFDVSLVATGCTFEGTITIDASTIPATGSTLKFATGAAVLGDNIELVSTSTTKFFVRAISSGAGGITIT
jgi:hypothetical protein